jgi:hypothetical protein
MKLTERELQQMYQKMTGPSSKVGCLDEDALIRAATGQMSAADREGVVAHIASCSDCAREYQIARGLRPLRGDRPAVARFPLAAAAALVIAIGALMWMFVAPQRPIPSGAPALLPANTGPARRDAGAPLTLGTPIVDLDADVRRGSADVPSITASKFITLILHLPDGTKAPLEIDLDGGATQRASAAGDSVTVTLESVAPGPHTIHVRAGERVIDFHFHVRQ